VDRLFGSIGIVDVDGDKPDWVRGIVIELEFARGGTIGVLVEAGLTGFDSEEAQDGFADFDTETITWRKGIEIRERGHSILNELSKLDG